MSFFLSLRVRLTLLAFLILLPILGLTLVLAVEQRDDALARNLILLLMVTVLALAMAWAGASVLIVRRVNALLRATRQLSQGDLSAERIEIVLAKQGNKVERLEGYTRVRLKLDKRTAVGARLTYYASDEKYVMSGAAATPVKITESQTSPSGAVSCSETTGRTLTFFKSTDTIEIDGNEQTSTETQYTSCAPPSTR